MMSMLQHPAISRLFYGGPPSSSSNSYVNIQPVPVPAPPERSHSPHSVDGSRTRRKNRERRGTENSLPVTFDAVQVLDDLRKDTEIDKKDDQDEPGSEATTPTASAPRKDTKRPPQKMEPSPDFQVPFPQVQDAARAKRSGDWEREQALRSPTLSAHSNTSGSHTTAPTTTSTANTSAGASGLTIPGAYDSGSASGGSGVEVTPTRETVNKVKRSSGGSVSGNNSAGSNPPSQAGFYTQQQLAQHLPPNPSPNPTQNRNRDRAPSPAAVPLTGSPQAQGRTAGQGSSPSQVPRQAYPPPPPPAPTMTSSSAASTDSFDAPTLSGRSYTTTAGTTTSLPTLPDSPPPEGVMQSPPFGTQHLGPVNTQHLPTNPPHLNTNMGPPNPPTLSAVANMMAAQAVPISPVHPRPMNRTAASVLGPTKMAESWTAVPPPEELNEEVQERKAHLTSARDGAAQRGHRGTGSGSMEIKDVASWAQAERPHPERQGSLPQGPVSQHERQGSIPHPERQGSIRRPKVVTQSSMNNVPQVPPVPPMTRNATMPITTRYETMSPPPMRESHQHGLHLDLHDNKPMPEKPQPAPQPARIQTGRGPSPAPRGRPPAATPPYTYEDPYRGRSGSHASYQQPKIAPPPPAPAPQPQWAARAPGGIVPFNEDLDHDEHEQDQLPPPQPNTNKPTDDRIVDWANHTQSQYPLAHPNQPPPGAPAGAPVPPPAAQTRGRSRSRGRDQQAQAQPPLMDPATMYQQQQQQQQYTQRSPEANGTGRSNGGRSPVPPATHGGTGSGSSETEDLKTPRSPSVPLPGDGYGHQQRFGYNQFSVGPPTVNHIYTQDLGHNGQMYPSMGFAQSQYALHQMGAGPQGMAMQMQMGHHPMNGRQVNGVVPNRDAPPQQGYNYGYPQDLSSSASGDSFLNGYTSNQLDARGYPNHIRPSAPVPPTPSSGTAPTSISGEIRNGTQGHIARAQTVLYNPQQQMHPQQQYPPYNYAQAQMSYAMDPYRAPSVVSSFMASPFSHNPFLPPVEPQSTQSSPSHQPIGLPFAPSGPTSKRYGGARMGTKSMGRRRRMMEEFRPESTVPNDTASEAETEGKRAPDGTETEFETETEMEEVWLEESDDDELDNEYHPTYFVNPAKRKRRFEQKWEQMVKLFREIDRETDATMILAAAPPDQHQTHLLLSRAILRDTSYSHIAQEARSVFSDITIARRRDRTEALRRARQERQRKKAADDRLATVAQLTFAAQQNENQGVGSGSDETSVPAPQPDQDLRMALDAARTSLQEMRRVYDEMESRHREESNRRKEESLNLEKLLTSLLSSKAVQQQSSS